MGTRSIIKIKIPAKQKPSNEIICTLFRPQGAGHIIIRKYDYGLRVVSKIRLGQDIKSSRRLTTIS